MYDLDENDYSDDYYDDDEYDIVTEEELMNDVRQHLEDLGLSEEEVQLAEELSGIVADFDDDVDLEELASFDFLAYLEEHGLSSDFLGSDDQDSGGRNSDLILSKKMEEKFSVPKNPKANRLGNVEIEFSETISRMSYEQMK